ncbi:chitinase [Hysterangium stoloniferum]|nr:chitinase [Hysterangium stoloniferum]
MLLTVPLIALASAASAAHSFPPAGSHNRKSFFGRRANTPKFVATSWFAGWHVNTGFPVSDISWDKYTHLSYSFATTTPDVNALAISADDETTIPAFVAAAHENNVSVSIAVGGWTGSRFMSTAVGSAQNRTAFVKTLSDFVSKYKFDGIDFDWEQPGKQAIGCNIVSPEDTANYLRLLQELRRFKATSGLILTVAAPAAPFVDSTGVPSTSVSGFAKVLDYIKIMNYDVWGPWTSVLGPNSPLEDACAPPQYQLGSAVAAVAAWKNAGMPLDKIVLGVAGYGYGYTVAPGDAMQGTDLAAYPKFNATNAPPGDAWSGEAGPDICGVQTPAGSTFAFRGLVAGGFLDTEGKPTKNIQYRFDNCSQTAYVYDPSKHIEVSFDDVAAFTAKGKFIKENSLRGFALWETGGDYDDLLINGVRSGAGLTTPTSHPCDPIPS